MTGYCHVNSHELAKTLNLPTLSKCKIFLGYRKSKHPFSSKREVLNVRLAIKYTGKRSINHLIPAQSAQNANELYILVFSANGDQE